MFFALILFSSSEPLTCLAVGRPSNFHDYHPLFCSFASRLQEEEPDDTIKWFSVTICSEFSMNEKITDNALYQVNYTSYKNQQQVV